MSTSKEILYEDEARKRVFEGAKLLASAVKKTLGPRGRNVVIQRKDADPVVTKDGVSVAREINFKDNYKDMGARLIRQASSRTSDTAGDGTTTATVLAEAMIEAGFQYLESGANPIGIRNGMQKALDDVLKKIPEYSVPVKSIEQIKQVGTIAANNDPFIGEKISEALKLVGKDGVISVEESATSETLIEVVEGMQLDKGLLHPKFANNEAGTRAVLENAHVLLLNRKIENLETLQDLLNNFINTHSAEAQILIVANDFGENAIGSLVVNKIRGSINCCAIKSPGFGERTKPMMEDLAALTGGRVIDEVDIETLQEGDLSCLGQAKKIVITQKSTLITEGAGDKERIKARVQQLKESIASTPSDYEVERTKERISQLSGGIAKLKVGAATEVDMKEKKDRIEDTLHATRAAMEMGVVPGGGVALLRIADDLKNPGNLDKDELIGYNIVLSALTSPIRQIAINAGKSNGGLDIVNHVLKLGKGHGYNALTDKFEHMMESGVIDPAKVTKEAVTNAVSVATMFLILDVAIALDPSEKQGEAFDPITMFGPPGMA